MIRVRFGGEVFEVDPKHLRSDQGSSKTKPGNWPAVILDVPAYRLNGCIIHARPNGTISVRRAMKGR